MKNVGLVLENQLSRQLHRQKMGDLITLAKSFAVVAYTGAFDNAMWSLHSCTSVCPNECPAKKSVLALTSVTTHAFAETAKKLKGSLHVSEAQGVKAITEIMTEIWAEFNMAVVPLEFESYTPRNKLIHAAMFQKARLAFEIEPGFAGWRN